MKSKSDTLELTQLGLPPKEVPCNDGSVHTVAGKEVPCAGRGGVLKTGGFKGSKPLADLKPLVRDIIPTDKVSPIATAVVDKKTVETKKPNYLMIGLIVLGGYLVFKRFKK